MNKYILGLLICFSITSTYTMKHSSLHDAVAYGDKKQVQKLINDGLKVNKQDNYGNTPLHIAAYLNHTQIAQLLTDIKVKVNIKNKNGETPLYIAVFGNHMQMINLLINAGARVDIQNIDGNIPLHVAAFQGNIEIVQRLIKNCCDLQPGSSIHMKNNDGLTPQQLAELKNYKEIISILKEYNDIHITLLHWAASEGYIYVTKVLLDAGADVNIQNNAGNTPLYYAARNGHINIVRMLINHCRTIKCYDSIHAKNNNGLTAQQIAMFEGHNDISNLFNDYTDK